MKPSASFTDAAVQRCPFSLISQLHAHAPVYVDPVTGFHVVTRYDDIAYVSSNPDKFSNKTTIVIGGDENAPGAEEVARLYAEKGYPRIHTLVTNDPPSHTMFRAIVDRVFTASFVRQLEPYIESLADGLIDEFISEGKADLLRSFCVRLPMHVISDQLGASRDDWERFKRWSDTTIALINPALSAEERLALSRVNIEMQQYLASKQAEYIETPADNLLSRLAHAEVDGRRLTTQEFVNVADQLLVAGNETTTGGIGHAVAMLIRDPALKDQLVEEPELIANFVEEVLRLHAPSPHLYRQVVEDVELSGVSIPKGAVIMLSYLAGNYDPARYPDAGSVDLKRKGLRNHLAFGRGIHYCIGNLLARAEMRIAITRLLARLKDMQFDPDFPEPQIAAIYHVHTLDSLHVRFTPQQG